MDKYLSVITNFGCHYKCPECIVRENGLKIPKTTIEGLNNLTKEIKRGDYNWVSISGGGDPLFEIENHLDWYDKFFLYFNVARICNFLTIKSELHTSYLPINNEIRTVPSCFDRFIYKFDRTNTIHAGFLNPSKNSKINKKSLGYSLSKIRSSSERG